MTEPVTIQLRLTGDEYAKLLRLADATQRSPEQCLRGFVQTCQPGGSGWSHPAKAQETKT